MKMKLISDDTFSKIFRFNELVDLVNKKDGRRELTFEDQGYVENIDLFLTGCISRLHVHFYLDGSSVNWKLLNNQKQFKTMLDFHNGIIKCQDKFITEIEGYMRANFIQLQIHTRVVTSCAGNYEDLINFLKL